MLELVRAGLENQLFLARLQAEELGLLRGRRWWWRLKWALLLNGLAGGVTRVSEALSSERTAVDVPLQDLLYGETPVLTAWQILFDLGVGSHDVVVDLGCGRGLVPVVAGLAFGCSALGVEIVPARLQRLRHLAAALRLEGQVEAQLSDFRDSALPKGSVYFLSPISLEESSWMELQAVMEQAPAGSLAVVLCEPLRSESWVTEMVKDYRYSWGSVRTYIQRRKV
jgi:hypothetical protein